MEQKYTLKQIKTFLKKEPFLKFSGLEKPDEKNPVAFIERFFHYNKQRQTVYVGNGHVQCESGLRRSIGDIFKICYHYFPKLTMTTLYKTLIRMSSEGKVISSICMATGLRVYRATKDGEKSYFNGQRIDEFTVDLNQFEEIKACKASQPDWGFSYDEKNIKFVNVK